VWAVDGYCRIAQNCGRCGGAICVVPVCPIAARTGRIHAQIHPTGGRRNAAKQAESPQAI
jgi:hypothetical protein